MPAAEWERSNGHHGLLCRSLERLVSWHAIQFANTDASNAEPSQEEQSKVSQVVAEADHPDYWFSVSKDGNREQHYRGELVILYS